MKLPSGAITPEEYWTQHIKAAEKFNGSNKEYCKHAGIKYGSLSGYRKKMGFTGSKDVSESRFAKLEVPKSPVLKSASILPEPEWLARFLKAWLEQ